MGRMALNRSRALDANVRIPNPWIALLRAIDLDPRSDDAAIRFVIRTAHEQAQEHN
jgi:hypothetical protein